MSRAPQGVRRRPLPLSQPCMFSLTVRTPERGVHAPASAPFSLTCDGSSSPPVCSWWILEFLVVFLMEMGLLVRRVVYTRCLRRLLVLFASWQVLFVGVLFFSCVLLFTLATCHGRF